MIHVFVVLAQPDGTAADPDRGLGQLVGRSGVKMSARVFLVSLFKRAASGPRSSVSEQREFLEDLQAEIVGRMQAGENPFQIVDTIELAKYQDWAGYDDWLSMNAWRIMLEMFMGH